MRQQTILIVDDDESVLDVMVSTLDLLGYAVVVAHSGADALSILGERPSIDLLLTDIVMPGGMDGWDLARRAKELSPALKVLYATAYSGQLRLEDAELTYGPLLSKPWRIDQLAGLVRWTLAQ